MRCLAAMLYVAAHLYEVHWQRDGGVDAHLRPLVREHLELLECALENAAHESREQAGARARSAQARQERSSVLQRARAPPQQQGELGGVSFARSVLKDGNSAKTGQMSPAG